MNGIESETLVM